MSIRPASKPFSAVTGGLALLAASHAVTATELPLWLLQVPPGFEISVYADAVPDARQMALSPRGVLYVGSRQRGEVRAVVDEDGDGRADHVKIIATDLVMPTGVAYRDGSLWVADVSRILRFDDIDHHLDAPPTPVVVVKDLPSDRHHGWKAIGFGPDGLLYVPIGAPCNICDPALPYASILRMRVDGGGRETVARGVRNSVGMAWHPRTGELWFTDNGRDWLGDDLPSCELNHVTAPGQHFGYPYFHGAGTPDPEFAARAPALKFTPSALELGGHVAPLGLAFYTGKQFPAGFKDTLFIAEHGSWNRSRKSGYQVVQVTLDAQGKPGKAVPFITGWLQDEMAWGRPTDIVQTPAGELLIADDQAGVVYRVRYTGKP